MKEAGVQKFLGLLTATSRGIFECRALEDIMRLAFLERGSAAKLSQTGGVDAPGSQRKKV